MRGNAYFISSNEGGAARHAAALTENLEDLAFQAIEKDVESLLIRILGAFQHCFR